jgi:hypothetical protein
VVYAAKRDRWVIGLVVACGLVSFVPAVLVLLGLPIPASVVPVFLATPLIGLLPLWVVFSISYEITASELIVRMWPLRWRIPLSAIESVEPVRGWTGVLFMGWKLAPSLDRLRVNYRSRFGLHWGILISPRDQDGFLRQLTHTVPTSPNGNPAVTVS